MASLFIGLLAFCAVASAAAQAPRASQYEAWRRADANHDGRLTREEARRLPRLAREFEAIDRNADGAIGADEVRAWRAARRKQKPPPQGVDEIFRLADRNRDGVLTREELTEKAPRLVRQFEILDADRDGRIARAELLQWFAERRSARRPRKNA